MISGAHYSTRELTKPPPPQVVFVCGGGGVCVGGGSSMFLRTRSQLLGQS